MKRSSKGLSSREQVVQQAKTLCKDYVIGRLKRNNLNTHKLALATHAPTEVEKSVVQIGQKYESMHHDLYREISGRLRMTMSSEENVKKAFHDITLQLFKESVTWGKIVALFALAGTFSADCVRQGHADFVFGVVESFTDCIDKYVADWIIEEGGWTMFVLRFKPSTPVNQQAVWILSAVGALIGFIGTLILTARV